MLCLGKEKLLTHTRSKWSCLLRKISSAVLMFTFFTNDCRITAFSIYSRSRHMSKRWRTMGNMADMVEANDKYILSICKFRSSIGSIWSVRQISIHMVLTVRQELLTGQEAKCTGSGSYSHSQTLHSVKVWLLSHCLMLDFLDSA